MIFYTDKLSEILRIDGVIQNPIVKFFDRDSKLFDLAEISVFAIPDILGVISGYLGH